MEDIVKHKIVKFLVGIICLAVIGVVVMFLWNWLMPSIFSIRAINFWEALGLFILSRALFGHWGIGRAPGWKRKYQYYKKFSSMSPEERERFKEKMFQKWCSSGKSGSEGSSND
jgi:hypothetical protein